jgi:hypothetical protein
MYARARVMRRVRLCPGQAASDKSVSVEERRRDALIAALEEEEGDVLLRRERGLEGRDDDMADCERVGRVCGIHAHAPYRARPRADGVTMLS